MNSTMKIFAFHLLNDFSGSPKVLKQLVNGWTKNGMDCHIVTCSGREGFLSDIKGIKYHHYWYRFAQNPLMRLFFLMFSQLLLIVKMYPVIRKNDIIYVNTVLPFGAGILGKLKGCKVIYHIHETSMKPWILKKILFGIADITSTEVVYVSKYLADQETMKKPGHVLYNALETSFLSIANQNGKVTPDYKNVLMICSLKAYKGVNEYVQLAKKHPEYAFRLVVNASTIDIEHYFTGQSLPDNLTILPTQKDVHPQYQWADVVLNLSRPDGWVETFGLTVIEAMAYGLPVIVPPVGGIAELVENGSNGYKADSRNVKHISQLLVDILEDKVHYQKLSTHTKQLIIKYEEEGFLMKSCEMLKDECVVKIL
jgi:glycosyltransferase involved in cell wall biosynthesis